MSIIKKFYFNGKDKYIKNNITMKKIINQHIEYFKDVLQYDLTKECAFLYLKKENYEILKLLLAKFNHNYSYIYPNNFEILLYINLKNIVKKKYKEIEDKEVHPKVNSLLNLLLDNKKYSYLNKIFNQINQFKKYIIEDKEYKEALVKEVVYFRNFHRKTKKINHKNIELIKYIDASLEAS